MQVLALYSHTPLLQRSDVQAFPSLQITVRLNWQQLNNEQVSVVQASLSLQGIGFAKHPVEAVQFLCKWQGSCKQKKKNKTSFSQLRKSRNLNASRTSACTLLNTSAESVAVRTTNASLRTQTQRPIRRRRSAQQEAALNVWKVVQISVGARQGRQQSRVRRTGIYTNTPILNALLCQQSLHSRESVTRTRVLSSDNSDQLTLQLGGGNVLRPEAIHRLSYTKCKIDWT